VEKNYKQVYIKYHSVYITHIPIWQYPLFFFFSSCKKGMSITRPQLEELYNEVKAAVLTGSVTTIVPSGILVAPASAKVCTKYNLTEMVNGEVDNIWVHRRRGKTTRIDPEKAVHVVVERGVLCSAALEKCPSDTLWYILTRLFPEELQVLIMSAVAQKYPGVTIRGVWQEVEITPRNILYVCLDVEKEDEEGVVDPIIFYPQDALRKTEFMSQAPIYVLNHLVLLINGEFSVDCGCFSQKKAVRAVDQEIANKFTASPMQVLEEWRHRVSEGVRGIKHMSKEGSGEWIGKIKRLIEFYKSKDALFDVIQTLVGTPGSEVVRNIFKADVALLARRFKEETADTTTTTAAVASGGEKEEEEGRGGGGASEDGGFEETKGA